ASSSETRFGCAALERHDDRGPAGGGWQQHASGGPEAAWHDGSFLDDHVAQVRPLADARAIEQHAPVDRGRTGDLDSLTGDDAGAGERQTGVEILARRADVEER